MKKTVKFLLTHPVWDVTKRQDNRRILWRISTHTSRVGCDLKLIASCASLENFYSHIPCGMWRGFSGITERNIEFLLTHPVWDVTLKVHEHIARTEISTHTSRVGCDCGQLYYSKILLQFLLTHPVWDVTNANFVNELNLYNFYSHIPCGMWLNYCRFDGISFRISTHTSRVGCDLPAPGGSGRVNKFLLTHPVWDVTWFRAVAGYYEVQFLLTHPVWDVTIWCGAS